MILFIRQCDDLSWEGYVSYYGLHGKIIGADTAEWHYIHDFSTAYNWIKANLPAYRSASIRPWSDQNAIHN